MADTMSQQINFWDRWAPDGKNRAHIPPLTPLVAGLRAGQLLLDFLILILAAISADRFGSSDMDAYGMTFFTFVWTLFFLGGVLGVPVFSPEFYNIYGHLAGEGLTCIWWLVSWALCAARASDLDFSRSVNRRARLALDTLAATAGIGALQWLLFIATMALLVRRFINERYPTGFPPRQPKPGPGPGPGSDAAEAPVGAQGQEPPTEMEAQPAAHASSGRARTVSPYPEESGMPIPAQPQ